MVWYGVVHPGDLHETGHLRGMRGREEGADGKEGTGRVEGGYVECWVVCVGGRYACLVSMRACGEYACLVWRYREDREEEGGRRREGGEEGAGAQGAEGKHRGYLRDADRGC